MHRIFLVDELLCRILEYLDKTLPDNLARLARTCRNLHDPCLRILWRQLCNISPLIRLLPCDAWEIEDISNNGIVSPGTVSRLNHMVRMALQ